MKGSHRRLIRSDLEVAERQLLRVSRFLDAVYVYIRDLTKGFIYDAVVLSCRGIRLIG